MKLYIKEFALSKKAEAPADVAEDNANIEKALPGPAEEAFDVNIGQEAPNQDLSENPTQKLKEVLTGLLAEESDASEAEDKSLENQTIEITED